MALKRLGTEHYIAIGYLSLPNKGGKTIDQIAEESGVSRQTIHNWRKDPLFERELKKEIVRQTQDRLPNLFQSMVDHAINDGNAAMAKLIVQVNEMLTDKVEVTENSGDKDIDRDSIRERLERLKGSESDDK